MNFEQEVIEAERAAKRQDLRGCSSCRQKMLDRMKRIDAPKAVFLSWGVRDRLSKPAEAFESMGYDCRIVTRGKPETLSNAVRVLAQGKVEWLYLWQRPFGSDVRKIADLVGEQGGRRVVTDHGVWPHYQSVIFDPVGENAGSSVAGRLDTIMADPVERAHVAHGHTKLNALEHQLRTWAAEADDMKTDLHLQAIPRDFMFFAMQRNDKVVDLDARPEYRDHHKTACAMIEAANRNKVFVVIKPHPQGPIMQLPEFGAYHQILKKQSHGKQNDRAFAWLLQNATQLIVVNSTSWMKAAALNKPIAALGKGWYSGNDVLTECAVPDEALVQREPHIKRARDMVSLLISRCLPAGELGNADKMKGMIGRFYAN